MGLKHIQDNGTFYWHCDSPNCQHHNCADPISHPDAVYTDPKYCVHHLEGDKPAGEPLTAHISHEEVRWLSTTMIALPKCTAPGCTAQMLVKAVFTEDEMKNRMIDEKEEYVEKVIDPDYEAIRLALQALGHTMPQKIQLVKQYRVTGQHLHPQIERHQKLAEMLKSIGKHPPVQEVQP